MKTQDIQLFSMFKAYDKNAVFKAIDLFKDSLKTDNKKVREQLKEQGWVAQHSKPDDREFYFFDDEYWVQTDEARQRDIEIAKKEMTQRKPATPAKTNAKEDMKLTLVDIKCPVCRNKMYKQAICGGCKEGKKGYKIRLLCEDNSEHEVLL